MGFCFLTRHALIHVLHVRIVIGTGGEPESRPMWDRWLSRTEEIRCSVPEFGIIAFPRIEGVEDTIALSEYLAAEHQVDVVPGEFFGLPEHLRIGCGVPAATLQEGLARLERGIKAFRARMS